MPVFNLPIRIGFYLFARKLRANLNPYSKSLKAKKDLISIDINQQ